MTNHYGNQAPSAPFGNIFSIGTPAIDHVAQQYMQTYQRGQQMQMQHMRDLDESLRKNMTNLKPGDQSDFVSKYNDWRSAQQNAMLSDTRDRNAYMKAQMDAQQKYADVLDFGNKSSIEKQNIERLYNGFTRNPKLYTNDAPSILKQALSTPTSKMNAVTYQDENGKPVTEDLSDVANRVIYHGPSYNAAQFDKNAYGKEEPRGYYTDEPMDKDGIQVTRHNFSFGNNPAVYKQSYASQMYATPDAAKHAPQEINMIGEQNIKQTLDEYSKMKKEDVQKRTGSDQLPDLKVDWSNPVDVVASYKAAKSFMERQPQDVPKVITNQSNKIAVQNANTLNRQETMEGVKQHYREQLADYNRSGNYQMKQKAEQDLSNGAANQITGEIQSVVQKYKDAYGDKTPDNIPLPVTETYRKLFDKKNLPVSEVYYNPASQSVIPVYHKFEIDPKTKKAVPVLDAQGKQQSYNELSQPEPLSQLTVRYTNQLKKETVQSLSQPAQSQQHTAPVQNSPAYKKSDLIKAGWTPDQIDKASKAGKIKVQ